jgi:hypothetical protein
MLYVQSTTNRNSVIAVGTMRLVIACYDVSVWYLAERKTHSSATSSTTILTWTSVGLNVGHCGKKAVATNLNTQSV